MRHEQPGPRSLEMRNRGLSILGVIPKARSARRGFTLIEVLISLAIVGGLLVTLIYTLNYHLGLVERQEIVTIAMFLAKDKLNDLEEDLQSAKGSFEAPYEDYAYETSVKESQYLGVSELVVSVRNGSEEVKLNEFVNR